MRRLKRPNRSGQSLTQIRSGSPVARAVEPSWRRRGVATALCQKIVLAAAKKSITRLYLQTECLDGGLYTRLGWTPLRQHHEGGVTQLIMVKDC